MSLFPSPVQDDRHFLTVCCYVEANALRAGLVRRAEDWTWGGLCARRRGGKPFILSEWPVVRPRDWLARANDPLKEKALEGLRTSVNRGRPWGQAAWVDRTVTRLSLEFTQRNPGRPPKQENNQ